MKQRIYLGGYGTVSPAGWGIDSFRDALAKGQPIVPTEISRPGWTKPLWVLTVPAPSTRPAFLGHARVRRASQITHYAVGAALEAVGEELQKPAQDLTRIGLVFTVMSGCVNYSRRFYEETLADPLTASPLIFPETVFNAPASHLAALLGISGINYTLVGDPGCYLVALALAAQWITFGLADAVIVVGAEETDWLTSDASFRFRRNGILSAGAGAIYFTRSPSTKVPVELSCVTGSHSFVATSSRAQAAFAMRAELPPSRASELLCDGSQTMGRSDRAERMAWSDWGGGRLSPKTVLGEGLTAGAAWQCVAAVDALTRGLWSAANVSVVGCNQQAIGARFEKT